MLGVIPDRAPKIAATASVSCTLCLCRRSHPIFSLSYEAIKLILLQVAGSLQPCKQPVGDNRLAENQWIFAQKTLWPYQCAHHDSLVVDNADSVIGEMYTLQALHKTSGGIWPATKEQHLSSDLL